MRAPLPPPTCVAWQRLWLCRLILWCASPRCQYDSNRCRASFHHNAATPSGLYLRYICRLERPCTKLPVAGIIAYTFSPTQTRRIHARVYCVSAHCISSVKKSLRKFFSSTRKTFCSNTAVLAVCGRSYTQTASKPDRNYQLPLII